MENGMEEVGKWCLAYTELNARTCYKCTVLVTHKIGDLYYMVLKLKIYEKLDLTISVKN